ncbi:dihydrodipicolinate synthase family protein [Alkalihalobacillus pseudalcaliphilus]|uniref:dihydrodipicolinate synthase family protein n=1 Tax=Alkalihalobacillus pseudalcaliphilus TaxID=79884 RepID=UPI00064D99B8|nr:dihydrodipicolinate synthase family protein [Alkalihalobacillus pseudalcaliphilus]KMK74718.1 dihydrodipicolinate synthase [Alkalihalobacillus pseudalcaliphilus]
MNNDSFSKKFHSISGITITPFKPNTKEVDWAAVRENVNFLIESGVDVIVPCGNTSEFYALTIEEAKEEIKQVVHCAAGRATVVAGIGYSVETAIEMGRYAKEVGADSIMIHMPVHPYITDEGALAYFKKIIQSVDLPAVIYFKDPHISDQVLIELAQLERLVAVKYAINDLARFALTIQSVPNDKKVAWICGTAEKWAPFFFSAGAVGFTSGLVNVFPQKSLELMEALQEQNQEQIWSLWKDIIPFEDLRAKYNNGNNVVVIKEAMEYIGLQGGVTREPVSKLNDRDRQELELLLHEWGLSPQVTNG